MSIIIMVIIFLIHDLENFIKKKEKQMMEKMKLIIIKMHQILNKRIIKWDIIIGNLILGV